MGAQAGGGEQRCSVAGTASVCLAVAAVGAGSAAQATTAAPEYAHAWLNPKLDPGQRASELLRSTLAQKLRMVNGTGFTFGGGSTTRVTSRASRPSASPTCTWPTARSARATAAPASPDSPTEQRRVHLGPEHRPVGWRGRRHEQAAKGRQVWLAPNLDVLGPPYGGRAFEGYGEPYLSSQDRRRRHHRHAGASMIATASTTSATTRRRSTLDRRAGLAAGPRGDLRPCVPGVGQNAGVGAVMCSYNQVERLSACQNFADAIRHARRR